MKASIWLSDPEAHDYPAALDYLELLMPNELAQQYVDKLQDATTIVKKAKDIFRASALTLLDEHNFHVNKNLKKVKNGTLLSPILLVKWNNQLIIADGYHRMCAAYQLDEDLEVPCRLV